MSSRCQLSATTQVSVSVVVPCYRVEQFLEGMATDLHAQTQADLQTIWVDDGSVDGTACLCEYLTVSCNVTTVTLHTMNGGLAAARNRGEVLALGKYLGFVDPDDGLEPNMYEILVNTAEGYALDVVLCGYHEEWGNGCSSQDFVPRLAEGEIVESRQVLQAFVHGKLAGAAYAWNKLFRRKWLELYSLRFPEGVILSEDSIFFMRCLRCFSRMAMVPKSLYHYRRRPESLCGQVHPDFFHFYTLAYLEERAAIEELLGNVGNECDCCQESARRYIQVVSRYLKRWSRACVSPLNVISKACEISMSCHGHMQAFESLKNLPCLEKFILRKEILMVSLYLLLAQWLPTRVYMVARIIWRRLRGKRP